MLNGIFFMCNKVGHMVAQCRSKMNSTNPSFSTQCFSCNKFGHNLMDCRYMSNKSKNVKCYTCGRFGHIANECRTRGNQWNNWFRQRNDVCYNCKKLGHIARFCRGKNMDKRGPRKKSTYENRRGSVNKGKNVQIDEKGKGKVTISEIKDQMKKTSIRKSDSNVENGFTPGSGIGNSSRK